MDTEIDRAPNLMGKYLLAGWVMTNTVCPIQNCNVPLLRSKDNTVWFCVLCDKEPGNSKSETKQQPNILPPVTIVNEINDDDDKVDSVQQNSIPPPSQYDEIQMRRDQSQRASHLIAQHLLQGWALIDQICLNVTCYGVPLIRSRDKKKYCVICQNYYVNESELGLMKHHITGSVE
ncbi:12267_t:CDS:2 [Funneliformis caledonium]|uniref:12267_t:CDS:1 n=1 Tax=Funneliformis caledonium TaxID=1117310 RepID=A0A9N8VF06_9GLOM|nr:12267_t:CDS:2 [Funneliformis caledonium]